jgi:hypothetical protein
MKTLKKDEPPIEKIEEKNQISDEPSLRMPKKKSNFDF